MDLKPLKQFGNFEIQNRKFNEPMMGGATAKQGNPSSLHRVPIIAMTAHAMKGDREKCLERGNGLIILQNR